MEIIPNVTDTVTVTTNCLCETENDETGEFEPSNECFGDCGEWQIDDLDYLIDKWQKANEIDDSDPIKIEVNRIGWTNSSAFKWTTAQEVNKSLFIDSDFTIEFWLTNDVLTARRYSHDEPTGTGIFTFTHYKGCITCNEPVAKDTFTEEMGYCIECQHLYLDEGDN